MIETEKIKNKLINIDFILVISWFILLACILASKRLDFDTDIMWHYKTGEYIVNNLDIPKYDIFSWQSGLNWMSHEWLYDIFLYLFYSAAGAWGSFLLTAVALILPWLISYKYVKNRIKMVYIFLLYIGACLICTTSSFCARPSEWSTPLFLIASIFIVEERKYKNIVFFLISVFSVNIHGGSISGLLIIPVLVLFSDIFSSLMNRKKIEINSIKQHLLTFALGFTGTLLNPRGIYIYKYALNVFFDNVNVTDYVSEWQPMTLDILTAIIILGFTLMMGYSKHLKNMDKVNLRKYVLIFRFLCYSFPVSRMNYIAMSFIILYGYDFFEEFIYSNMDIGNNFRILKYKRAISLLFILTGIIFLAFGQKKISANKPFVLAVNSENQDYYELLNYMRSNNISGRLFNSYNFAGYLMLNDIKVFIDPRCDPYMSSFSPGNDSLQDYFDLITIPEDSVTDIDKWNILNEKYDFEYALFDYKSNMANIVGDLKKAGNEVLFENESLCLLKL